MNEDGYRFYDGLTVVTFLEDNENVTSKMLSLVNYMVLIAVKATKVRLAGDGCHKLYPKAYVSRNTTFDGIRELYTVHVILKKKV